MKYKIKHIQISCDGGAATGKSTGARLISKKYGLKFLSSGLLYRYAGFLLLRYNPKNKIKFLKKKFKYLDYSKIGKLSNCQIGKLATAATAARRRGTAARRRTAYPRHENRG